MIDGLSHLVGWLAGWLTSVHWLSHLQIGCHICKLAVTSVNWLAGWLTICKLDVAAQVWQSATGAR